MNCSEAEKKWQQYLKGELTAAEEEEMEAHINACAACSNKLNRELNKDIQTVNEEKQIKILKRAKWKNRISNVVYVISVLLAVTMAGTLLSWLFYSLGDRGENATRTSQLITEFTMPNIYTLGGSTQVKPLFGMEGNYRLYKDLGRDSITIGNLQINMFFNRLSVQRNWTDEALDVKMHFLYPNDKDKLTGNNEESPVKKSLQPDAGAWKTLDILPEGTVAELAVSFDTSYSLDELYQILSGYDLQLLWFAVDTGVEAELRNESRGYVSAGDGILWGFPNHSNSLIYEPDSPGNYSLILDGDSAKKTAAFIEAMEFLIEHEKWAARAHRRWGYDLQLKKRLDYVQENGLRVYGAVVTGPTKELLKLKEVDEVKFSALGEVALWNWETRYFRGTIYN
ncbi:anti-sigma factor [Desulfofalx alkaliphila]|uniref:anti-sigma factor n=1 Tax=Desulfofalx alkaliphila TaxID=105483 RepID=UPI0004E1EA52|nr:anti-sigma factor [Desulfofalx alkaliphila]